MARLYEVPCAFWEMAARMGDSGSTVATCRSICVLRGISCKQILHYELPLSLQARLTPYMLLESFFLFANVAVLSQSFEDQNLFR